MPNIQTDLSDAKFFYDFQEQSDNYRLLSSLLNFEESPRKDSEIIIENVTEKDNMDWLDLVDFKEEVKYEDERNNPEQDAERKRKHNKIEKARRLFIDAKIRELGYLLPKKNEAYHELTKDIKHNKGGILRASVAYLRILKSDQIKKQKFEEKCKKQEIEKRKLIMKLQEYEREMKSYGIPVKEFAIHELNEFEDMDNSEGKPFYKTEKALRAKHTQTFEQLDDLMDDDTLPVSRHDPMFSSFDCDISPTSSKSSRCSSTESTEDSDSMSHQQSIPQKEKRKLKNPSVRKPRLELYNTRRMPVVSRPYQNRPRFNPSIPFQLPRPSSTMFESASTSSIVFPLPHGLSHLGDSFTLSENAKPMDPTTGTEMAVSNAQSPIYLQRSRSSSSEDEQSLTNITFEIKTNYDSQANSPSPPPRPLSVIKSTASVLNQNLDDDKNNEEVSEHPRKRKVILQGRD